jgi:BMFP domain-containing protein YqiC
MTTAQKAYAMLGNESLWDVAARCHELFTNAGIAYSVCGGVAVCLHGYQRNTTDLDLVIRSEDNEAVRQVLIGAGFIWIPEQAEFHSADGIAIQFLIAGQKAGKGTEVSVSEPIGELNVEMIEGLSVVRLSRLIEMKIACGMSNLRRTHKDFADVVELISIRKLDGSFARFLHKSLQPTFRELVRNATVQDE